jgi:hypothetical protein
MTRKTHLTLVQTHPAPAITRPLPSPARRAAVWILRTASATLDRLASAVAEPAPRVQTLGYAEVEFYAQAGAPEGALYVDGRLVGLLPGVRRL